MSKPKEFKLDLRICILVFPTMIFLMLQKPWKIEFIRLIKAFGIKVIQNRF